MSVEISCSICRVQNVPNKTIGDIFEYHESHRLPELGSVEIKLNWNPSVDENTHDGKTHLCINCLKNLLKKILYDSLERADEWKIKSTL